MNRAVTAILDLLFPPKCVFCGTLLDTGTEGICGVCKESLPWLAGDEAVQSGTEFSLCAAPLRYQDHVRDSIHRYKFGGCFSYADAYGPLMARCIADHLAGRYDLISWVPLSPKRKRERGYDQAFLLARAAARHLGEAGPVPVLRKVRHTAAQSGLAEAEARRANAADAYGVPDPAIVRDKQVLLIDDVVTTGSTFSACASALREAGASAVVCAALARAR